MNKSLSKESPERYYELCFLIHQTCNAVEEVCWNTLREYGISSTAAMVLYLIPTMGGEVGSTELSRSLCRRPHSVYELLVRMEKAGFVRKVRRPQTKRKGVVRFELTKKGLELYTQFLSMDSTAKLMSKLSEQELRRLKSYLETILAPSAQQGIALY